MGKLRLLTFFISCGMLFTTATAQRSKIDSLTSQLASTKEDTSRLKIYVTLAELYSDGSPSSSGMEVINEGMRLAINQKNLLAQAKLLRFQGQLFNELDPNDYDTVLVMFNQGLNLLYNEQSYHSRSMEWKKEIASNINSTAYMYWQWGKLKESLIYYDSAIHFTSTLWTTDSTDIKVNRLLGLQHNSKGAALWGMGNFDGAMSHYLQAIKYFQKVGMLLNLSLTYTNIGLVYDSWGQKAEALTYFRRGVDFGRKSGSATALGYALSNMGRLMDADQDNDSALFYYQASLEKYLEANNEWGIGLNLNGLGRIYTRKGEYDKAMNAFSDALDQAIKNGSNYWEAMARQNIGMSLAARGDLQGGLKSAEESNKLALAYGYKEILKDNYENISDIYERLDNHKKAHKYFRLYSTVKDSIFSEQKFQQITRMKEQFETETREKENEALRRDSLLSEQNLKRARLEQLGLVSMLVLATAFAIYFIASSRKIRKINGQLTQKNEEITRHREELGIKAAELQKSNDIKNLMFSIVSHDMRGPINNLDSLISLVNLELMTIKEFREVLPAVVANIGQIKSLTDNLLYWARSQMEGMKLVPKTFDLQPMLTEKLPLFEKVAQDKGVKIVNTISETTSIFADQYTVELVLRNLVTNAIKFCSKGDSITLSANNTGEFTTITIADTGQGIAPEYIHRIFKDIHFTTTGTSNEKGVGLGLVICLQFVQLNGGRIWVDTVYGEGSSFHFTLPNRG